MTIVKKYRYGLSERRREDQIDSMISVYIARLDQQAAGRRDYSNRLPSNRGQLQLNPVIGTAGRCGSGLNAGQICVQVSVKIRNRKLLPE